MAVNDWDESLATGVNTMDADHKKLFEIAGRLRDAMQRGEGKIVAAKIVGELGDYAKSHFDREEQYLKQIAHPDYQMQKEAHAAFAVKVADFAQKVDKQNLVVAMQLLPFVNDWLIKHISQVDMRYKK